MRNLLKTFLCIFLSLLPTFVFALGFGEVKLYSYLNEPLDAEIELLGAENFEPSRILVTLASAQEFNRAGLARPMLLSNMQFQVERRENKTYIKIISNDAIHQPYLEYLLDLSWPGGRLVRGYTLLLDPAPAGTMPLHERRPTAFKPSQETNFTAQNTPPNSIQNNIQNALTSQNTVTHQDRFEKLFDDKSPESFTVEAPPMTIVSTVPQQYLQDERSRNLAMQNPINSLDSLTARRQNLASNQFTNQNQATSSNQMQTVLPNQYNSNGQNNPNQQTNNNGNSKTNSQNLLALNGVQNNNNNAIAVDKNHFWFAVTSFSILTLFIALFIVLSRRRKFSVFSEQPNLDHENLEHANLGSYPTSNSKLNLHSEEISNSNSFSTLNFANQDHTYLLDETTKNISSQVSVPPVQNEMNMKLELARYYLEVDDEESALQLLRDVLVRGSDWEKQQAQKLLESHSD